MQDICDHYIIVDEINNIPTYIYFAK